MDHNTLEPQIGNPEIDDLAGRLAAIRGVDKVEALRGALLNELLRAEGAETLSPRLKTVQQIVLELHAKAGSEREPITKDWVDSLYEDN